MTAIIQKIYTYCLPLEEHQTFAVFFLHCLSPLQVVFIFILAFVLTCLLESVSFFILRLDYFAYFSNFALKFTPIPHNTAVHFVDLSPISLYLSLLFLFVRMSHILDIFSFIIKSPSSKLPAN